MALFVLRPCQFHIYGVPNHMLISPRCHGVKDSYRGISFTPITGPTLGNAGNHMFNAWHNDYGNNRFSRLDCQVISFSQFCILQTEYLVKQSYLCKLFVCCHIE